MVNPYFEFKNFRIYQAQSAFKVTTDSCILGAYAEFVHPERICDIGTGTGILALMMAQKFSTALIDAVEMDTQSAEEAKENVRSSPWNDRITVYTNSIQNFSETAEKIYDLVICNPPYFEDHVRSSDHRKNITRHNISLTLLELASSINRLLSKDGCFFTILPPASFRKFYASMRLLGFHLIEKLEIFVAPGKSLYRIIGGFKRKTAGHQTVHHLYIYDARGEYTEIFKAYLKEFYLAF